MDLRVRDALKLEPLNKGRVVAGHGGLSKIVKNVSVIEIPEATKWLKGNELFISAFYSIAKDVEVQKKVIKNHAKHNGSGIIICHFGVWLKEIHPEVKELADQLDFPIVVVPPEIAYIEIISPLMDVILNRQNMKLEFALNVQRELTKQVIQGHPTTSLIKFLSEILDKPMVFFDANHSFICQEKGNLSTSEIQRISIRINNYMDKFIYAKKNILLKLPIEGNPPVLLIPIISGEQFFGTLVVFDANLFGPLDSVAIDQAISALALASLRQKSFEEIKVKIQKEFIEDLLNWNFIDSAAALKRAKGLNLDIQRKALVATANIDSFGTYAKEQESEKDILIMKEKYYSIIREVVREWVSEDLILNYSDTSTLLLLGETEENNQELYSKAVMLGEKIINTANKVLGMNVSVGIGKVVDEIYKIKNSYEESQKALVIGKKIFGQQQCVLFTDVRVYSLLLELVDRPEWDQVMSVVYDRLKKYDKKNNSELLKTFKYLLDYDNNTDLVAKNLFVHKNTVLYRRKKIEEILGFNPFEKRNRFSFEVGRIIEKFKTKEI